MVFFWDIVTCCRDIGNNKNPTISQHINTDFLEALDDKEAKTESFHNNITNNGDVINKNEIILSVNDDHSTINDKMSRNYIDEDSLKSTKVKDLSYNDIMSVWSKLSNALKLNKKYQTIVFAFHYNS